MAGPGTAATLMGGLVRTGWARQSLKTYYVLRTEPLTIYLGNVFSHLAEMAYLLKDRRVHFIKNAYHSLEAPGRMETLVEAYGRFRPEFPNHSVHFVAATRREEQLLRGAGMESVHYFNKNALVDEKMFDVQAIEPGFDAVHNGQLLPYKRHELAEQVGSLALLVYRHSKAKADAAAREYESLIRQKLQHAHWLNDLDTFVPPYRVPELISQARVGLCLSSEEGPMAASMEYLMCGLPVVSTRNIGGRDEFFDEEIAVTVDDNPEAVSRAVAELCARGLSREHVRERVLSKVRTHRQRFIDLVNEIGASEGNHADFAAELPLIYSNKLRTSATFPVAFLRHVASGMPIETCTDAARLRNQ